MPRYSMQERERIKGWLQAALEATGWNPAQWAREAKVAPTTITRILNDKTNAASFPSFGTIQKLTDAANRKIHSENAKSSTLQTLVLIPIAQSPQTGVQLPEEGTSNNPRQILPMGSFEGDRTAIAASTRDFPIFASRDSVETGEMLVDSKIIGMAERPSIVRDNLDAFQTAMTADDMEPKYRRGDTLIVDPHAPAADRDFVMVVIKTLTNGTRRVLVRQLTTRLQDQYTLTAVGSGVISKMARSDFEDIFKIVGSYEK